MVIGQFRDPTTPGSYGPGSIFTINTATSQVFTIAHQHTKVGTIAMGPNWVEMASDNLNLVVGCLPTGISPTSVGAGIHVHEVGIDGSIVKTLVNDLTFLAGYVNTFDLDGDGTWILGGGSHVWSYDENTSTYSTLYNAMTPAGTINAIVLDPALPKGDMVLTKFNTNSSATANLVEADRNGVIATIATSAPYYGSAVKIDFRTGDYICTGFGVSPYNAAGGEATRVTKAGKVTTLNYPSNAVRLFRPNGLFIDKQHMAWVLAHDLMGVPVPVPTTLQPTLRCSLFKLDLRGVFISMYNFGTTLTRNNFAPSGLTRYGSRNVVCNGSGKPGTTVRVRFSSRKAADAGKAYQLACSFSYTNGIRVFNGEYLDLTPDDLFFITANNRLPTIFANFGGILDRYGEATAAVRIPAALPPGLGVPIYVSGIVIDPMAPGQISTVGNTHWFTLR